MSVFSHLVPVDPKWPKKPVIADLRLGMGPLLLIGSAHPGERGWTVKCHTQHHSPFHGASCGLLTFCWNIRILPCISGF